MAEITLKDRSGNDTGQVELDDAVFGIEPNVPVMHQVVTAQLAHRRAGTHSTKTRAEVRGGGAKPYRQKGTGRARQGSIRAPQFTGGGIALGPKPRSYSQRTPKKMIKLALRSALSDRASEGKVVVVDGWGFDTPRTKDAKAALEALGLEGRVLLVVDRDDAATALSFRNLPEVQLIAPGELNAYDVLCNDWIVFTKANVPGAEGDTTETPAADDTADLEHGEAPAGGGPEDETPAAEDSPDLEHGEAEPSEVSPEDETRAAEDSPDLEHGEAPAGGGPEDETRAAEDSPDLEHGEAEPSSEASEASPESASSEASPEKDGDSE